MIRALAIVALTLLIAACGGVLGGPIQVLNAAATAGTAAHTTISAVDQAAQMAAVETADSREEAKRGVAVLRAHIHPVWNAYRAYRDAWIATAAVLATARAAEAAGAAPDLPKILTMLSELAKAQAALTQAVSSIRTATAPLTQ